MGPSLELASEEHDAECEALHIEWVYQAPSIYLVKYKASYIFLLFDAD
jgi:hypothetical protein